MAWGEMIWDGGKWKKSHLILLFVRLTSSQDITETSSSGILLSQICSLKDCLYSDSAHFEEQKFTIKWSFPHQKSHIYFYLNKSFQKIPSINKFD